LKRGKEIFIAGGRKSGEVEGGDGKKKKENNLQGNTSIPKLEPVGRTCGKRLERGEDF